MTETVSSIVLPPLFPDHTQLPESDGTFVKNFQEHPQSLILTDSIGSVLQKRHPDGQYCIGQDCGIYWRETDPPERGAEAPDWFYVPNVPPKLDGMMRRSYVLWREHFAPLIALKFASGNGEAERDKTPWQGKYWVYEQVMRIPFYGIYEVNNAKLEVYHFVDGLYQQVNINERGRYPVVPLGVELGLWQGSYQNQEFLWLRWWDLQGNLLLIGDERAQQETQRAEQAEHKAQQETQRAEQAEHKAQQETQRAEQAEHKAQQETQRAEQAEHKAQQETQRVARLAERLRAMGIDPDAEDSG